MRTKYYKSYYKFKFKLVLNQNKKMSFSSKNPINSPNYYTKKYLQSKKIKLNEGPNSVKASQMSNIIGFDNKVKGNMIRVSYFNSKLKNNKVKKNVNDKSKNENQSNYYSLFLENTQNNISSCKNKFKKISYNNSCYYLKSSQNPLIININNNNSKINNKKNINLLSEVLQKYSNFSHKPTNKKIRINTNFSNNKRNNSLKNFKSNLLTHTKQKRVLSTENLFNNSPSTSNVKKRNRNSVLKINQNNNYKHISLKSNNSYIITNITAREEKNKSSYVDRIKRNMKNKNENIRLILLSRNNQNINNVKLLNRINRQNLELSLKYNQTSFFNNSISEITKKNNKFKFLNIGAIPKKNQYIITPKNIKKECNLNVKGKNKIKKKYFQKYDKKEFIKQKSFYDFGTNQINNNSKENINNNIIIQKNNTSINLTNKNILSKKPGKNSLNIADIFRIKKTNSKIIRRKKSNINIRNYYSNKFNDVNLINKKDISKKRIYNKSKNFNEVKNNKIQNKLFNETNLINSSFDDNFDDLFSIVKKLKFNSNNLNTENIFSIESQEYKNYSKKFNSLYNKFYAKYITKKKPKNKNLRKSNSKIFTESTKMKTTSHSKKVSIKNIDMYHKISEFKLD